MGAVIRLAAMPGTKRLPPLLALLAVLAALSGCGSDEISGEIPPENAVRLNASLNEVSAAVEGSQDCETAKLAADQFVAEVNALPADAGTELKTALREAGENLGSLVDAQCPATGTSGTTQSTTSTTPTDETTTTTTTDETTTDETTTTTDETTTTTDEQPPPGNGNGGGPPSGGTGGGTGDETGD
jgi:hypothetical protein